MTLDSLGRPRGFAGVPYMGEGRISAREMQCGNSLTPVTGCEQRKAPSLGEQDPRSRKSQEIDLPGASRGKQACPHLGFSPVQFT